MGSILIVEDDPEIREDLAELLREEGHRVVTAADGAAALQWLEQTGALPALIFLDLMMPVMDGWELRLRLKRDPRLASVPVVVMSGVSDVKSDLAELDTARLLVKPFSVEAVLELVATMVPPG